MSGQAVFLAAVAGLTWAVVARANGIRYPFTLGAAVFVSVMAFHAW